MRLLAKLVNMVVGLVLMPIIIRELGDRHYGIWVLSATFLGFYGLFDLGITSAVGRFVSRALGAEDEDDLRRFFATSFYLLSGIGVVVLLVSLVLAWLSKYIASYPADAHLLTWLILILGVSLAVQFPIRAFNGLLTSHLRYDLTSSVRIAETLLRAPLVILVFHWGYGLLALAVVSAGSELAAASVLVFFAFWIHRGLTIRPRNVDWVRVKTLFGYGFFTFLAQVADLLRFHISPLVITAFRTVSMVTPFAIANRLSRIVVELMVALLSVMGPVFSRQEGQGDAEAMRSTYLFTCRIATYASVLIGGLMMILGEAFIERWLGPQYTYVTPLMQVLVVGNIFTCASIPTTNYLFGTSQHKYYAITNGIHGVLCLVLTSALIARYELMGVALGITIPTILIKFLAQPMYACRSLQIGVIDFYVKHALPNLLLPSLFLGGVLLAASAFLLAQYLRVFSIATLSCVMFVPFILVVGLNRAERRKIVRAVIPARLASRSALG